jgi:heme A synthase
MTTSQTRFARFAWGVVAYNVFVILWGAFVRASGSGAGCGSHWPLCNGTVIPRAEYWETLVEFGHRLTSGLDGLVVLGMVVWAFRAFHKRHIVRRAAVVSFMFILIEGLIGRQLVVSELVAYNDSAERASWIAIHLVNTFLLVASLTLTAWWAGGGQRLRLRNAGTIGWLLGVGFFGMLLVGASGAITALGDTLFPAESLRAGIAQDFSPTAHFLIRLRVWHPLLAVAVGVYTVAAGSVVSKLRPSPTTKRLFWANTMFRRWSDCP